MTAIPQPDAAHPPLAVALSRPLVARTALALLVALAFGSALQAGLVLDAPSVIAQDPRLHGLDGARLYDILFDDLGGDARATGGYRPLTTLSYAIQYAGLGCGAEPFGYALGNVLLHLGNVWLLHLLLLRLWQRPLVAFAAASVWAVHPLASESIANLVGRADLIAACGVLLGLVLRFGGGNAPFSRMRSVGIALAQLLAVGGKESGVVLLPLLIAADLCIPRRATWRERIDETHAWATAALVLWAILRAIAVDAIPTPSAADNPLLLLPAWHSIAAAALLLLRYLALTFLPLSLSCDWSFDAIPVAEPWFLWCGIAAALACATAIVLALRLRGRAPVAAFLTLAWFVAFAPVANVFVRIGTVFGERLAYLPMVMPIALVCMLLTRMRSRAVATALLATSLAAFAWLANARNLEWRSHQTLWGSAVAAAPGSFKAHGSYAVAMHEQAVSERNLPTRIDGILEHATTARQIATKLPPRDVPADVFVNLAAFLRAKANFEEGAAKQSLLASVRAEYEAGIAAENAALDERERATKGNPRLWLAWGQFLQEQGDRERAARALARAIALAPAPEPLLAYANAELSLGNARDAALAASRAVMLNPTAMDAWQLLQQSFAAYREGAVAVVQQPDGSPGFNRRQDGLRTLLIDAAKAQAAAMRDLGQHKPALMFVKRARATLGVEIDG